MPTTKTLTQSESPIATTDSRPVPDPTFLTTQQLTTAIDNVKALIGNVTTLFDARLEAMDKAVLLLKEQADRLPSIGEITALHGTKIENLEKRLDHKYVETATDITHLRDLLGERIGGLEKWVVGQLSERDKRTDQLSLADKTAVAAALQAAKEAVGAQNTSNSIAIAKSESSTVESIRQLQSLFTSAIAAVNDKLNDTRSRLDRGDGSSSGQSTERFERRDESRDSRGLIAAAVGIIGIMISVGTLILLVVTRH